MAPRSPHQTVSPTRPEAAPSVNATRALYRAAIGPRNTSYYLTRFLRFDIPGHSRRSWNWAACFFTFYWLLYRRMFAAAMVYLLAFPVLFAAVSAAATSFVSARVFVVVYAFISFIVQFVLVPSYANALYYRHIRARVRRAVQSGLPLEESVRLLRQSPHTTGMAICLLIGLALLVLVVLLSFLAQVSLR